MVKYIMKINKLLFLFLILLLPIVLVKPVFAGFGISPGEIYNDTLKPGSKFETEIVLSRSEADEDLKIIIETELGETESWIKFEPSKEFLFLKGEKRKTIKAVVDVPNNAPTKNYKGLIRIKASSVDTANSGVSIVQGARMEVTLVTTSLNINILSVKSTKIPEVSGGAPILLYANIENNGNTEIAPDKVTLEIQRLNKDFVEIQEITKIEKIAPNTTKELVLEFKNNNLPSEEYFGIIKVFSEGKEIYSNRLVFRVIGGPSDGSQQISSTNNKIIFKHIGYLFLLLIPIIVAYILRKKTKNKKLKKVYLLSIILYIIIGTILIYLYHQKLKSDMAKPGDIGNVQGESVEFVPTEVIPPTINNGSPLVVNQETTGYPIYRTPDINSTIVYTATEDETFTVISQIEGWYQVSTKNGTGGWLPQTSVKKSE